MPLANWSTADSASLNLAVFGGVAIEKYRVLATLVGLAVFGGEMLVLNRTKIGLLIRAGVETARWSKRSAIASTSWSWRCSWRLGAGWTGRGDDGALSRPGARLD